MPKVSVVIPVYKVEPFLRRCVDSVLHQTLTDLDIVLVDDGSTDHCPQICDSYAQQDSRVQVIHKQNGGLASARNAGMRAATGEYLFFLDSDDWIEADGMETLYQLACRYQVDFVRYRAIRTGWPGLPEQAPCMLEEPREMPGGYYDKSRIEKELYPRLLMTNQLTLGPVVGAWGALYKTEFLMKNQLFFSEEIRFSEDVLFSAQVVYAANHFYYLDQAGIYHYFYNPASISKSFRADRWESCKQLINRCEREFSAKSDYDFADQLLRLRWFCILLALGERKFLPKQAERADYCKKILQDPVVKGTPLGLDKMDVSWKQKVLIMFCKLNLFPVVSRI